MSNKKTGLWGNIDAHENYRVRWSQKVAPLFLQWLDAPKECSWVDIGCGTGGLTERIASTCNPVWDYAGHMQIMRYFFDTAIMFDARSAEFDDGIKAPICRPIALKEAFVSTGLTDISVNALDITTPFENFDDYRSPFLRGVGSAPKYCVTLEETVRNKIKIAIKEKLPTGPEGEILLAARAWAISGIVKN